MLRFISTSVELAVKLDDGAETLYPQAVIKNSNDALISTVDLSHSFSGIYTGTWTGSTETGDFKVDYLVYTDSDHLSQSTDYTESGEHIFLIDKDDFKADVSAIAIEANVETHVTNSLNSYDPPTRTELTSDKNEIITEIDANETKIDTVDSNVDTIVSKLPTNNMMGSSVKTDKDDEIDSIKSTIEGLNDVSSGDVQTACDASLASYDPPTRAELTTDKESIISEIDANETKIDTVDTVVDAVKAKTDTIDWTDITFIKDVEGGRWIRDGTTLTLYKSDNITVVATFNLKKADGDSAGESDTVFERVRA